MRNVTGQVVRGEDFFDRERELARPLWGQIEKSWLGKLFQRVKKISGAGFSVEFDPGQTSDWSRLGRDLAEALSGLEGRWLLQIDELPVFIVKLLNDGDAPRERVREFLYWMHCLRLEFPAVRWVLAGSIGLDTVTARLNVADAINDYASCPSGHSSRLYDELGRPDADHAKRVLDAAARDPDGASRMTMSQVLSTSIADPDGREDKLRYLLDVLENDGYLVEHAGRWRFRFPLLREYWLKRVAS